MTNCAKSTWRRWSLSNIVLRVVPYEDQVVEDVLQREMRTGINAVAAALLVGREGNSVDAGDRSGIGSPYDATTDKGVTRPRARREIARGEV